MQREPWVISRLERSHRNHTLLGMFHRVRQAIFDYSCGVAYKDLDYGKCFFPLIKILPYPEDLLAAPGISESPALRSGICVGKYEMWNCGP